MIDCNKCGNKKECFFNAFTPKNSCEFYINKNDNEIVNYVIEKVKNSDKPIGN